MPLDITAPERKTFRLEKTDALYNIDEANASTITVVQARVKQNSERADLFKKITREFLEGNRELVIMDLPLYNLLLKQIYLTMVDCNLTADGELLFRFKKNKKGENYLDMSWTQFVEAIGYIPESVLLEMQDKVLEVNPHWIIGSTAGDLDLGEEY